MIVVFLVTNSSLCMIFLLGFIMTTSFDQHEWLDDDPCSSIPSIGSIAWIIFFEGATDQFKVMESSSKAGYKISWASKGSKTKPIIEEAGTLELLNKANRSACSKSVGAWHALPSKSDHIVLPRISCPEGDIF